MRTLVVTNDFPPRPGGIQVFVHELCLRLPDPVVYASSWHGAEAFDRRQPFEVVRHPGSVLLPLPPVRRAVARLAGSRGCDTVLYGAAAPLGLLTPALRSAGVGRAVGLTHGHEAGWALLPGASRVLREIGERVDVLTYVGQYTGTRIAGALTPAAAARMSLLPPGVDTGVFRPGAGGADVRARLGLAERPVAVCVSRLVPRKGQDVLLAAWPAVLEHFPDAVLLLVGGGPARRRLGRLAARLGVAHAVVFTGSVARAELPAYLGAGDVFAMPCRTRLGGVDVEALGMVFLEAAACGLPVVAGDSGGAADAVRHGDTGYVVDGSSPAATAARVVELFADPDRARAMGRRGRDWVCRHWRWDVAAARLRGLLDA